TSTKSGIVSGSGGGTSNFLRADGTWAVPPSGGSGITGCTNHGITIASSATTIGTSIVLGANQLIAGVAASDPVAITVGGALTFSGTTLTIANNAFTAPKRQKGPPFSVFGRSANSTGNVADIAGANTKVLRVSAPVLGFGAVNISTPQVTGFLPTAN